MSIKYSANRTDLCRRSKMNGMNERILKGFKCCSSMNKYFERSAFCADWLMAISPTMGKQAHREAEKMV